jgi:hypothetical protein
MDTSPINLQALIAETEALDWDGPSRLESLPIEYPKQATFGLIGKLLPAKPPHPQWVHDTLVTAWKFASSLEIKILSSNKFLFTVLNVLMLSGYCIKALGMFKVFCLFSSLGLLN